MPDDSDQYQEDIELAALIMAGNCEAEEKFFAKYRLWIEKEIRWQGVPAAEIEDVVQNVLLAAFDQLRRRNFHAQSSLKTWLGKIVHGKVIDYWRKSRRTPLGLLTGAETQPNTAEQLEAALGLSAVKLNPDLVIAVREVLQQMPEDLQLLLVLNRAGGYTIQEISHSLALTAGQVAKRLYKAEELFRRLLCSDEIKQKSGKAAAKQKRLKSGDGNLALFLRPSLGLMELSSAIVYGVLQLRRISNLNFASRRITFV